MSNCHVCEYCATEESSETLEQYGYPYEYCSLGTTCADYFFVDGCDCPHAIPIVGD
jgi:hypothetical protein